MLIKTDTIVVDKKRLKKISDELVILEKEKNLLCSEILQKLKKTVAEHKNYMSIANFRETILFSFIQHSNIKNGTDYFAWNKTKEVQKDFENYYLKIMKSTEKFYFNPNTNLFFELKTFTYNSTSRSRTVIEFFSMKDNFITYNYSGTAYHGFGSVDSSVQQKLVINLNDMVIKEYVDSTELYHYLDCSHDLKTNFIKYGKKIIKIK